MFRSWRVTLPFCVLLALALSAAPASAAPAAVTAVKWTVTPAASYTVTNNGAQPLLRFNACLQPNTSYTIPFAVTVEGTGSFSASLARVGEATLFLSSVTFAPTSVNGTDTQTFNASVTLRTGSQTVAAPTDPPANRFGIYLEPAAGAAPLANSFLTIDLGCIGTGTPGLPNTGAGGLAAGAGAAIPPGGGLLAALLLGGWYGWRRRTAR